LTPVQWLESSGLGELARSSPWLYATASALHLLAMAVLVGTGLVLDVRLIGWTRTPLPGLLRWLTPAQVVAGGLAALSGLVMFSANATDLSENPAFQVKLVLLGLILGNALGFTFGARAHLDRWQDAKRPPLPARVSGWIALVGWPAVVVSARLIAFL
jgi:hypothetical protein